jgi:hypothetical protein
MTPLPFTIPDHMDRGHGDFKLTRSYTKKDTEYIRCHVFMRQPFNCQCCGLYETEEEYTIEVNNYELRCKD